VLRRIASWVAAILLLPALISTWVGLASPSYAYAEPEPIPGLALDGQPIHNIFAYGCDGQPLDGVQLFDQNGAPLTIRGGIGYYYWGETPEGNPVVWDDASQSEITLHQNPLVAVPNGWDGWNVYPLHEERTAYYMDPYGYSAPVTQGAPTGSGVQAAPMPYPQVPAISNACPAPSGSASSTR
jgi:hypothetical protein